MTQFEDRLNKTKEIGYVEKVTISIIYVRGLPGAKPSELVYFESGEIGQVFSLSPDYVEVLLLTKAVIEIGTKVARSNETLKIGVGDYVLGKTLNPLAFTEDEKINQKPAEFRLVDVNPPGINLRKNIEKPFETGITLVDLATPLGCGQRELIIGDRKTNKTQFLLQALYAQAIKGTICIYCAIAKRQLDIMMIKQFMANSQINKNSVLIASAPDDVPGLIFLTPYTAITLAEYFRDQGKDVLVILDDMTAHAKYYREISLLAERFPGRGSYPGDIFYIHAKIMERAGNFVLRQDITETAEKGSSKQGISEHEVSITCLPVAEMVMGDFSGYIQTNLMAMTDGHIYFDKDYFNEGRRPAINPFLSVTRVGRQAQTPLLKDLSRTLISFLVHHEKLKQFMHFGAELSEETKRSLILGDKILALFDQPWDVYVPLNVSLTLFSCIWVGFWKERELVDLKGEIKKFYQKYMGDKTFKDRIDALISQSANFMTFMDNLRSNQADILQSIG
jgi:F-type H+-transporting ATPase subunit alpha